MITLAIPKEIQAHEKRVAMVPSQIAQLKQPEWQVRIESGAGTGAYYDDSAYAAAGAEVCSASELYKNAQIILKINTPTLAEITQYPENSSLIGMLAPHNHPAEIAALAAKGISSFTLERIPRITRAQNMDVLSSQATVAGYKAALIAATHSPRLLPMLTTAAGTIKPATALVIGAGVAGLQAIATLKRLGAIVFAFDIRPAARQQIESLGAKMIALDINAESSGGYARELSHEEQAQLHALLAEQITKMDLVITTAAVPGKPAPKLITEEMIQRMPAGAIIVDVAAEAGGNTSLTKAGEIVMAHGVMIDGTTNLPSQGARNASDLYARNVFHFLNLLTPEPVWEDEIIKATLVTHAGKVLS